MSRQGATYRPISQDRALFAEDHLTLSLSYPTPLDKEEEEENIINMKNPNLSPQDSLQKVDVENPTIRLNELAGDLSKLIGEIHALASVFETENDRLALLGVADQLNAMLDGKRLKPDFGISQITNTIDHPTPYMRMLSKIKSVFKYSNQCQLSWEART